MAICLVVSVTDGCEKNKSKNAGKLEGINLAGLDDEDEEKGWYGMVDMCGGS